MVNWSWVIKGLENKSQVSGKQNERVWLTWGVPKMLECLGLMKNWCLGVQWSHLLFWPFHICSEYSLPAIAYVGDKQAFKNIIFNSLAYRSYQASIFHKHLDILPSTTCWVFVSSCFIGFLHILHCHDQRTARPHHLSPSKLSGTFMSVFVPTARPYPFLLLWDTILFSGLCLPFATFSRKTPWSTAFPTLHRRPVPASQPLC